MHFGEIDGRLSIGIKGLSQGIYPSWQTFLELHFPIALQCSHPVTLELYICIHI